MSQVETLETSPLSLPAAVLSPVVPAPAEMVLSSFVSSSVEVLSSTPPRIDSSANFSAYASATSNLVTDDPVISNGVTRNSAGTRSGTSSTSAAATSAAAAASTSASSASSATSSSSSSFSSFSSFSSLAAIGPYTFPTAKVRKVVARSRRLGRDLNSGSVVRGKLSNQRQLDQHPLNIENLKKTVLLLQALHGNAFGWLAWDAYPEFPSQHAIVDWFLALSARYIFARNPLSPAGSFSGFLSPGRLNDLSGSCAGGSIHVSVGYRSSLFDPCFLVTVTPKFLEDQLYLQGSTLQSKTSSAWAECLNQIGMYLLHKKVTLPKFVSPASASSDQ